MNQVLGAARISVAILIITNATCDGWACTPSNFTPPPGPLPGGTIGLTYDSGRIFVCCDLGCVEYTAGGLPPGLYIEKDPYQSYYSWIRGVPTVPGFYSVSIEAYDPCCAGITLGVTYTIDIGCGNYPVIQTTGLPLAMAGVPYQTQITVLGNRPPFRFSVVGGSLPPGVMMTSWGSLRGTATALGTYSFDVAVTDAAGCVGSPETLTIAVTCSSVLQIDTTALPKGYEGAAYAAQLSSSGGLAPFSYMLIGTSLPYALYLTQSGYIGGVPTVAGRHPFTVGVNDSLGCPGASRSLALWIDPALHQVDFLVGRGAGQPNPNQVRVFDSSGSPAGIDFQAYSAGAWGVDVDAADLIGDATEEIMTGPGPGRMFGSHVRVFESNGAAIPALSFFAYGTPRYGVNVGSGNLDPDETEEVLTGPGPGWIFGPHVRGWDRPAVNPMPEINYFAYGTLRYGVVVAAGDVDGDGYREIVTGPGPGPAFGAQIRGWDYDAKRIARMTGLDFSAFAGARYGARPASGDVLEASRDQIVVAKGPGPSSDAQIRGFSYSAGSSSNISGYDAMPYQSLFGARPGLVRAAANRLREDLVVGPGPDPSAPAVVKVYPYTGTLGQPSLLFTPFTGAYGVDVTGGGHGY